jgi:DNA-binding transcriptional LysR family regulator
MTNLEIEAFLVLCKHKNISKAAAELFISQSSLSERLKTLENKLNCMLFLRGKGIREITLTPEGHTFHALAIQYQEILEKMHEVGKPKTSPLLRITSFNSVGSYILAPVYEHFNQKFPHVQLVIQDLSTQEACIQMEHGNTDLAFTTEHLNTDQIHAAAFLSEPMVLVCSESSSYPDAVSLDMLSPKDEVHISWSKDFNRWYQACFGTHADQHIRIELADQFRYFMHRPNCWSIVPLSVAKELTSFTTIRQCKLQFYVPNRILYILSKRNNSEMEYIHSFISELKNVIKELKIGELLL